MNASETESDKSGGTRTWLAMLLVISLAFNFVIIGAAVADRIWSDPGGRGGSQSSLHLLPRQFFAELDDQRRDELRAVFRVRRPEYREERRALTDAALAFADAVEGQPYDPDVAQASIAEHTNRAHRLVDLSASVAQDLVEALTPEERRALAEAIRRRIEERRSRRSR